MLQVRTIRSSREKRRFLEFVYRVYRGNPCFKDVQVHGVRAFLSGHDRFTRACHVRPVVIERNGETVCQAMLIWHPRLAVLQVSFFEALAGEDSAVRLLLDEARREARAAGLRRLVIGLNGHVSYGVGFLCNGYDEPISFDSLYSPAYYLDYFSAMGFRQTFLSAYRVNLANVRFPPPLSRRIDASFSFRTLDMRCFRDEILLFGELCNECLRDTYLYVDRDPSSLYQTLLPLRPLLRSENLIFVMKEGREVGFMFWHPDYNQIIPGGVRNSALKVALRYVFMRGRITRFKLNTVGLLPPYRHTAALAGLARETHRYARRRFVEGETNFVWDNNIASTQINRHLTDGVVRRYSVFEGED
jgi:hypothetical protein